MAYGEDRDPLKGDSMSDTTKSPGDRSVYGTGMAKEHFVQATRTGKFPGDNTSGERSQGEVAGSGSIYAATLNERPNLSNPRNQGPTRSPSRMGSSSIPVATMAMRNTGKKG